MKNNKVTFLFVTYNRCPSSDFELNPLTWAVNSLEGNTQKIDEYIFINDGSTDNTIANIDYLKKKYDLNVKVISNKSRKGCSWSRKVGIENLRTDLFFMGDDDCLYDEQFVETNLFVFHQVQSQIDKSIAVLQVPIFENNNTFIGEEEVERIGKTYFDVAWFYHNFDKKVKNYHPSGDYGRGSAPLKVDTFKGVTLNLRNPFIEAGNFIDLSEWKTDYSEHIDISFKLSNLGYTFYYFPEESASCLHIRFGDKDVKIPSELNDLVPNNNTLTLGEMQSISHNAGNSGCRADKMTFLSERIALFLSFFLSVNVDSAIYMARNEYESLVLKSYEDKPWMKVNLSFSERLVLWDRSVKAGIRFAEKVYQNVESSKIAYALSKLLLPDNEQTES